jgi:hypothetical protein
LHKRGKELDLLVKVMIDAVGKSRGENGWGHERRSIQIISWGWLHGNE